MIFIKVLIQEIIVLVISVYTPQCGLDDSQKYLIALSMLL